MGTLKKKVFCLKDRTIRPFNSDLETIAIHTHSPSLLFLFFNLLRFLFFFNVLIYFWLSWVFIAAHGLSLVAASRGYSPGAVGGLPLLQSLGSRAQVQWLWLTGLVALQRVGSSQTGDGTHVPCIGRQILHHCTTREVLLSSFLFVAWFMFFPVQHAVKYTNL